MTDERLRDLGRRAEGPGGVEVEARLLLERVRVGELERDRLELAAYCGHEAARLATSTPLDVALPGCRDLRIWLAERKADRLAIWAVYVATQQALRGQGPDADPPLRALLHVKEWLLEPCRRTRDMAYALHEESKGSLNAPLTASRRVMFAGGASLWCLDAIARSGKQRYRCIESAFDWLASGYLERAVSLSDTMASLPGRRALVASIRDHILDPLSAGT